MRWDISQWNWVRTTTNNNWDYETGPLVIVFHIITNRVCAVSGHKLHSSLSSVYLADKQVPLLLIEYLKYNNDQILKREKEIPLIIVLEIR